MTDNSYILDALRIRRDELDGKRSARRGVGGFEGNVKELEAAIAELDAEITRLTPEG